MKKFFLLLFVAFLFSEVHSAPIKLSDEEQLSSLVDSFSTAIVKKNKAWLGGNLADACILHDPTGATLNKVGIIKVFTEGIYNISKSSTNNKTFKPDGINATGSAIFNVEGTAIINGESNDISGSYKFSIKFK